jgi:hypothetical protein
MMVDFSVVISKRAEKCLDEIAEYLAANVSGKNCSKRPLV